MELNQSRSVVPATDFDLKSVVSKVVTASLQHNFVACSKGILKSPRPDPSCSTLDILHSRVRAFLFQPSQDSQFGIIQLTLTAAPSIVVALENLIGIHGEVVKNSAAKPESLFSPFPFVPAMLKHGT